MRRPWGCSAERHGRRVASPKVVFIKYVDAEQGPSGEKDVASPKVVFIIFVHAKQGHSGAKVWPRNFLVFVYVLLRQVVRVSVSQINEAPPLPLRVLHVS